ncbi:MAG: methyltransferase domain-containing protein [Promethearchaeota archaeon]|nr:MAG: methyltransferase domain-containing protein [Candidatus Lokiarchaeota archaeon]
MILEYHNLKIKLTRDVYQPSEDSYLLAENLEVNENDIVLEIGTGTGIVSLVAGLIAEKVIALDISPKAVELARYNVILNELEDIIEVRHGHLFEPLEENERFNLIIFNPPYLPVEESGKLSGEAEWLERAWNGGKSGRELIDPFIEQCTKYLMPRGRLQMIQSSLSDIRRTCDRLHTEGFQVKIKAEVPAFFERIVLIEAWIED